MSSFMLCGKKGGCCPKVDIDVKTKTVTITDDYGGEIVITLDEFKQLQEHDMPNMQD